MPALHIIIRYKMAAEASQVLPQAYSVNLSPSILNEEIVECIKNRILADRKNGIQPEPPPYVQDPHTNFYSTVKLYYPKEYEKAQKDLGL